MTEQQFWEMLEQLDWTHEGDDGRVVQPVVQTLARLPDEEIFEFDNILARKLHELDSRELVQKLYEKREKFSEDRFLYNRCVAVVNGREYYEAILARREKLDPALGFEAILYVAEDAWDQKHPDKAGEYPHVPEPDYESGSNTALRESVEQNSAVPSLTVFLRRLFRRGDNKRKK